MALPHAQPGEVISLHDQGGIGPTQTRTLFKTSQVEAIQMVLPQGKSIAEHRAPHEIIVHCLEGRVRFHTMGRMIELGSGQMFYLAAAEPHAVEAPVDCCFLLTILRPGPPSTASA